MFRFQIQFFQRTFFNAANKQQQNSASTAAAAVSVLLPSQQNSQKSKSKVQKERDDVGKKDEEIIVASHSEDKEEEVTKNNNNNDNNKHLADMSARLSKSLKHMEEIDRKIAATTGETAQQLAFNETLTAGVADLLQEYILAATTKSTRTTHLHKKRQEQEQELGGGGDLWTKFSSPAPSPVVESMPEQQQKDDFQLDQLALQKSLITLQYDFEAGRMKANMFESLFTATKLMERERERGKK